METTDRISCNCQECKDACTFKPGWLRFGDEKIIADKMGISVKELFDKYLVVDWWQDFDIKKDYFGLSPAVASRPAGKMMSFNPTGRCIFFTTNQQCQIHEVAPVECQQYIHTLSDSECGRNHKNVAETWDSDEAKELIKELLGEEPFIPGATLSDMLNMLSNIQKHGT